MPKILALKSFAKKVMESSDTEIVKKLRKFQHGAKHFLTKKRVLQLTCESLFSIRLIGRKHLHIALLISGTALNLRLNKYPLYFYLKIDFNVLSFLYFVLLIWLCN